MTSTTLDRAPLTGLADTANHEYAEAERAAASALEHAILAGRALAAARRIVPPGAWQAWVETNFHGSYPTAYLFERLAAHSTKIQNAGVTTVVEARDFLVREGLGTGHRMKAPASVIAEAKRMAAAGMSASEISRQIGWSDTTVAKWVDPKRAQKHRETVNARRRNRKLAAAVQRRAERDSLAARAGGGVAEAYSRTRKLAQLLDRVLAGTDGREQRAAINAALTHLHSAEDEIVRALRGAE